MLNIPVYIIFWITIGKTCLSEKCKAYILTWFDILFRYFSKIYHLL